MPDVTLQGVSRDVDETNKEDEGSKGEDHREDENMEVHMEEDKGAGKPETAQTDVFCIICLVRLTSKDQAETHFDGSRHKKAVALLIEHHKSLAQRVADQNSTAEAADQKSSEEVADQDMTAEVADQNNTVDIKLEVDDQNNETKKSTKIDFLCEICLVKLTSSSQIELHHEGKKHKKALAILKEHPRSLADLVTNQVCHLQTFEEYDQLNNVCVVNPTSRSPNDPACKGSKRSEASSENTVPLNKKTAKRVKLNATQQNADKESDETGEKQDDAAAQNTSKNNKKNKAEEVLCNVCQVTLTSSNQLETHNEGTKHKKRALALAAGQTKPLNPIAGNQNIQNAQKLGQSVQASASRMKLTKDNECMCSICCVKLTSTLQAVMHYEGRQHKKAAAVAAGASEQRSNGVVKNTSEIICDLCHVTMSSQVVADAHYAGSKHKSKLQLLQSRNEEQQAFEQRLADSGDVCKICLVPLSSKVVADAHYAGAKHKRKLQQMQSARGNSNNNNSIQNMAAMMVFNRASSQVTQRSAVSTMPAHAARLSEEQRLRLMGTVYACDVCHVKVNSQQQMEAHWQGTRHKSQIFRPALTSRLPARGRFINGGMNNFPLWNGPPTSVRSRPTLQYNPRVL
ncbi:hypothetical protein BsWGS_14325 [Bradybaena similaris]